MVLTADCSCILSTHAYKEGLWHKRFSLLLFFLSIMQSERVSGPQIDGDRLACVGQELKEIPEEWQEVRGHFYDINIRVYDTNGLNDALSSIFVY